MLDQNDPEHAADEQCAERGLPPAPEPADGRNHGQVYDGPDPWKVTVLPHDKPIRQQVGNIVQGPIGTELEQQPSDMRVKKALGDVVWIVISVHMLVMPAVVRTPVERGTFKGRSAEDEHAQFHRPSGLEGKVGKQTVVSERDAHGRGGKEHHKQCCLEPIQPEVPEIQREARE